MRLLRRHPHHLLAAAAIAIVGQLAGLGGGVLAGETVTVDLLAEALRPPSPGGAAAVDRALSRLAGHRRLLMIGAHPDDEDTALLAHVVWDLGGEAAYLSLSRGEGGQNLIGSELGVGLGLLRTRELEAARARDGARQFFARAYDFGFSRSLAETLRRWDEQVLLADAVRAIRSFRPQVVVAVFPPTPVAGHGQHQAAGHVAPLAYRLAGDPAAFPEQLAEGLVAWTPSALYREVYADPENKTLVVPVRGGDPSSGRTSWQIAMASRSAHASQDMGRLEELGPRERSLAWLAGGAGIESAHLFAGIDTSLAGLAGLLAPSEAVPAAPEAMPAEAWAAAAPGPRARLDALEQRVRALRERLVPVRLGDMVPELASVHRELRALRREAEAAPAAVVGGREAFQALLGEKEELAARALAAAAGLALEAFTERELVVSGLVPDGPRDGDTTGGADAAGSTPLEIQLWMPPGSEGRLLELGLELEPGWVVHGLDAAPTPLPAGTLLRRTATLSAATTEPTAPRYLEGLVGAPERDLYDWSRLGVAARGRPFEPPPVIARAVVELAGTTFELRRAVVARQLDQARGEIRRPLRAVPPIEVVLPAPQLVALAGSSPELAVELRSHAAGPWQGTVAVVPPSGWPVPPEQVVTVGPGGRWRGSFTLAAPPGGVTGARVRVEARGKDGRLHTAAFPTIEYPHVAPVVWPRPAVGTVSLVAATLPPADRRIGYLRGASDRIPEVLAELGVPLRLLDGAELGTVDLAGLDVLVVGPRAYEVVPELAAANPRLLEWVASGGVLIVQYQQYGFVQGGFAPLPLPIARPHDRVTDEAAAVRLLRPDHPLWSRPNRLGAEDWEGWVQERGLYFARDPAPEYARLLAIEEPGVGPLDGGLLAAPLGRGSYVYTGLAFFRQLPAGVPGAVRLFLNLLSLEPQR
jgi:LmbE family N-acetylglucosaminyl deacetylase